MTASLFVQLICEKSGNLYQRQASHPRASESMQLYNGKQMQCSSPNHDLCTLDRPNVRSHAVYTEQPRSFNSKSIQVLLGSSITVSQVSVRQQAEHLEITAKTVHVSYCVAIALRADTCKH